MLDVASEMLPHFDRVFRLLKRHTPEQIIAKLRRAEIELGRGKEHWGMGVERVERLRELEARCASRATPRRRCAHTGALRPRSPDAR